MITNEDKTQGDEPDDLPPAELKDIARLALLLNTKQPPLGDKPTEAEIWAWMHDELTADRSAELKSYLARDEDTYSLWQSLRSASQEVSAEQVVAASITQEDTAEHAGSITGPDELPLRASKVARTNDNTGNLWQRLADLLKPAPFSGLATAAVVGTVVLVMVQQGEPQPDLWQDWQMPKSQNIGQTSQDQKAYQSVLAGMNAKMRELSIPSAGPGNSELPADAPDCQSPQDATTCAQTRLSLFSLGQIVIETRLLCLTTEPISSDRQDQLNDIVGQLLDEPEGKPFITPLQQWLASDERSQQCAAVNVIIDRALMGISS